MNLTLWLLNIASLCVEKVDSVDNMRSSVDVAGYSQVEDCPQQARKILLTENGELGKLSQGGLRDGLIARLEGCHVSWCHNIVIIVIVIVIF